MIIHNEKEISSIFHKGKTISEIRKGLILIWQAVTSCFGIGFWRNDRPWANDETWKNNSN